ncbi:MAG: hypothetical protein IPH57_12860 [Saprospiraceae bacterium]|nr:hypothetical protein [Saprospiraceae bacterium]
MGNICCLWQYAVISYLYGMKYYPVPYKTGRIVFYVVNSTATAFRDFYFFYDNFLMKNAILFSLHDYGLYERKNLNNILQETGINFNKIKGILVDMKVLKHTNKFSMTLFS